MVWATRSDDESIVGNILQAKDRSQVLKVESFEECEPAHRHSRLLATPPGEKKRLVGSPPSKNPKQYWKEIWRQIEAAPPLYWTIKRDPPKSS